jgi:hypothetical protein
MVLPSDPAQCPDLAGVYRAAGEYRAGDKDPRPLADLYQFLAHSLDWARIWAPANGNA